MGVVQHDVDPALTLRRAAGPVDMHVVAGLFDAHCQLDRLLIPVRPDFVAIHPIRKRGNRPAHRLFGAVDDLIVVEPGAYPGGLSRARSAGIAAALDDGFTVVLNGIELRDPTSVVLAGLFERAFGCSININGYLSARQQTSFGVHWDNQEVVILQLLGRKDWKIEAPTALSMNKDAHGESVSGQPV